MRKIVLAFLLFPLCSFAVRTTPVSEGYQWVAERCKNIQCTADNIKIIDDQISALIAKRLAYVRRQAELKARNVRVPNKATEPDLSGVGGRAKYQGYSPETSKAIFKEINEQSKAYEQQILDKKTGN